MSGGTAGAISEADFITMFGGSKAELSLIKSMMQTGKVSVNGQKVKVAAEPQKQAPAQKRGLPLPADSMRPPKQPLAPRVAQKQAGLPFVGGRSDGFMKK